MHKLNFRGEGILGVFQFPGFSFRDQVSPHADILTTECQRVTPRETHQSMPGGVPEANLMILMPKQTKEKETKRD